MEDFVRKKKPKSPKTPKSPKSPKSPQPDGETGSPDEDMMKQCKEMIHHKHHEKVVQASFASNLQYRNK